MTIRDYFIYFTITGSHYFALFVCVAAGIKSGVLCFCEVDKKVL